ncbi:2-oxoglutarate ferredoxin oxidoreductase subunit alpha [Candidatus Entotheonella serta]|nr:2-oxoglutarate ferredoxin oxidoreductase subunit alpha [Candidatus Entotheonella serta]
MAPQDTVEGHLEELKSVVIRLAGDSGDGMQLTGGQFTRTAALIGNDISTLPDFPAEIRAPAGSLPGVSSFQLNFSSRTIYTPGDQPNVLVAMNPAGLKTNIGDLEDGGILIINTDAFTKNNLNKAQYESDPLDDGSLSRYRVFKVPVTSLNSKALEGLDMSNRQVDRCKNFWALGLLFWLYNRPLEPTVTFLEQRFGKRDPIVYEANKRALNAGYNYGETTEIFTTAYQVRKAKLPPGKYRNITGAEAAALGFVTAARLAKKELFYGSYPITPASEILHEIAAYKHFGVKTFQAEDEIAAVTSAVGAVFGGALAMTTSAGPGISLKSEGINLAHMVELPLVIADIQRAGPSTGMPTKTEQGDLYQCMFGRNSDAACAIVAPATPGDCFNMAIEAFRIATKFMTPVFYLSDGYLGNGSEPWRIPSASDFESIEITHASNPENFKPYERDPETLARPWAIPGTPGLEHRIGGLEKADITGNVNYDPLNHEKMTKLRNEKIDRIANFIPEQEVYGDAEGELLVLTWGSTYGAALTAVDRLRESGASVSHAHLRYLNPFPRNLGDILQRFNQVLIPELNLGQLRLLIRGKFLVDAVGLSKVQGIPFKVTEIQAKCEELLGR